MSEAKNLRNCNVSVTITITPTSKYQHLLTISARILSLSLLNGSISFHLVSGAPDFLRPSRTMPISKTLLLMPSSSALSSGSGVADDTESEGDVARDA